MQVTGLASGRLTDPRRTPETYVNVWTGRSKDAGRYPITRAVSRAMNRIPLTATGFALAASFRLFLQKRELRTRCARWNEPIRVEIDALSVVSETATGDFEALAEKIRIDALAAHA